MIIIFLCTLIFSLSTSQPQSGFVYTSCINNNNLILPESPGGTLYYTSNDMDSTLSGQGLLNGTVIFNCTVVLNGRQQNSFPYKIFFGIHFRQWTFDTNSASRNWKNLTSYFPSANNVTNACGEKCPLGCMQLIHPKYNTTDSLCGIHQLTGTDYKEYFEESSLTLKFYLIGGIYYPIVNSSFVNAEISRPTMSFIIDFFSFYFGKCENQGSEFQCIYTDRCIDISLKCDRYGGMDCGIPFGGSSITYDQTVCIPSSSITQPNLLWLILLLVPFLIFAIIWLFYRPGICCWRCARLRNCHACRRASCIQCCTLPCVLGNAPKGCNCCKSSPNYDRFPNATSQCAVCLLLCCNSNGKSQGKGLDNSLAKNKVSPHYSNVVNDRFDNSGWTKYALGDGYHLRECR